MRPVRDRGAHRTMRFRWVTVLVVAVLGALAMAGEALAVPPPLGALPSNHEPPLGTVFDFTLNETARVTFTFVEKGAGQKGTLSTAGRSGPNKVAFQGRLNAHRKLPPGSYTVTILAHNEGGASKPAHLSFTIAG
jgi:hypothetical protein